MSVSSVRGAPQNAILRYGRLQICATVSLVLARGSALVEFAQGEGVGADGHGLARAEARNADRRCRCNGSYLTFRVLPGTVISRVSPLRNLAQLRRVFEVEGDLAPGGGTWLPFGTV